ncbi:sensor histidine kinase [Flavisolibacter ginsenosidimutans]|uniref:Oxygen sensor histidine kinase NreB n=1 Tax=Flavisolibacter ginsenosidimutans TaxID=661481 RepID=A0A5B8UL00_9BACT|nr:ATP-binding protein [Flavisolibacter ginsenosidimutans]QEC57052.1 sensor histidine kinase [Flavisolibacter ginsenosidimutans]
MGNLSKEVTLIVVVSFFLFLVAAGIIALVLVYRRKQVEYIHKQGRLKAAFEKELLEAQLEIQEQTMKHIAQEVHDNVNQTLGLAKLNLNTVRIESQNGAEQKIAATKDLVGKAIADLRNLSKTLHAEAMLSGGIARAIETELNLIAKTAVFQTQFSVSGEPVVLDAKKELILFRTVQETLNNAIKHSGANLLSVHLAYNPDELQLTVTDNGTGFDYETTKADAQKGIGLRNVQNRTKLIGGEWHLQSGATGTKVQITLPIIVS